MILVGRPQMKNLRLSARLTLLTVVSGLPMALIALWVIRSSLSSDINTARAERSGVLFQRPLIALQRAALDHRTALMLARENHPSAPGRLAEAVRAGNDAIAALRAIKPAVADGLEVTESGLASRSRSEAHPHRIEGTWARYIHEAGSSTGAGLWDQLLAQTGALLSHVGDTSSLILDPDLDSYYLMDLLVLKLPEVQGRLASALTLAAIPDHSSDALDFQTLSGLIQHLTRHQAPDDVQRALTEDARAYGVSPTLASNLPPALSRWQTNMAAIAQNLRHHAEGQAADIALFEAILQASAGTDAFWSEAAVELDRLLGGRQAKLEQRRTWSFVGLGITALVSIAASWHLSRHLVGSLGRLSKDLSGTAQSVDQISAQLMVTNHVLKDGAESQTRAVEETGRALADMAEQTRQTADHATAASSLSRETSKVANDSSVHLQSMSAAMDQMRDSASKIADIIRTIDEIAFQTNILALNAAVEAARAGEAGLGFAVVADEVRNLAQRSAAAARETGQKISEAVQRSEQGVALSQTVTASLVEMMDKARQVDALIQHIAEGARENSTGIEQVRASMTGIEQAAQLNAAGATDGSAMVSTLSVQTRGLKAHVTELVGLIEASSDVATAPVLAAAPAARPAAVRNTESAPTRRSPGSKPSAGSRPQPAAVAGPDVANNVTLF
jgi:hypothetical protein